MKFSQSPNTTAKSDETEGICVKKEMIKAIRMVNGFNPDLRVKLPYNTFAQTAQEECIFNFLCEHLLDIFGVSIYEKLGVVCNPQPGKDADDYEKVLAFVREQSRCVLLGIHD